MKIKRIILFIWLEILLVILLGVSGSILIYQSSKISEFIEPTDYAFEFDVSPRPENTTIILNSFRVTYDFTEKKGNITFEMDARRNIESLQFEIPSIRKLYENDYDVKILNYNASLKKKVSFYRHDDIYLNNIVVRNIPKLDDMLFLISFKADIEPSGAFIINNVGRFRLSSHRYGIQMMLGDNYICQIPCVSSLKDLEEYRTSYSKNIKLKFVQEASEKPIDFFVFKIEAINKERLEERNLKNGVGISLLISSLILLLETLIKVKDRLFKKPLKV